MLRAVPDKSVHFLGRGRKAGQIVGGAANQRPFARRRGGLESFRFEFRQDEVVDGGADPAAILDLRNLGSFERLERPERPLLRRDLVVGIGGRDRAPGPYRALLGPSRKIGQLLGRELTSRRHLQLVVPLLDRPYEQAFPRVARRECRTGASSLQYVLVRVEPKTGFGHRAVARQAVFREHGPNVRAEKLLGRFGPGNAVFDPLLEILDGFVVELRPAERHLEALVGVTDGFDQHAVFRVTWDNDESVLAPLQDILPRVQSQAAALEVGLAAVSGT